jgi:type II secretory pathway pseudopilin PulG
MATAASSLRSGPGATARGQRGVILIALLLMLVLVGVGALAAAEIWSTTLKREREVELLWVGEQYRHAIESYWKATPGRRKQLPSTIDQLLLDDRFPNPVMHLRAAYPDPMAPDTDFELIRMNNALVGVRSTSKDKPMKQANFPLRYRQFAGAEDYSQWQFIFAAPGMVVTGAPAAQNLQPGPGATPLSPLH